MLLYVVLQIALLIAIGFVLWVVWDAWRRRYWKFVVLGIVLLFLGAGNMVALFLSISGG